MARSPSRRNDDRYVRDRRDDRGYRRRSRSRDRDRRYEAREEYGRLDRPYDQYDDYRSSRRDRSRNRKRSRERSPVRDRRDSERDRARYDRDVYDDRDRKRSRRDERSPPRRSRDDGNRDRKDRSSSLKFNEPPGPSAAEIAEEEKKQRLAKVEAWKMKQGLASSPGVKTAGNSSAASPVVGSTAISSQPTTRPGSPAPPKGAAKSSSPTPPKDGAKSSSPAPYAGPFDPKTIRQRAAAAMARQKTALGGDVTIPKSENEASNMKRSTLADNSKVAPPSRSNGIAKPATVDTKVSGFGLSKTPAGDIQIKGMASKVATAALDEEEEVERKFRKLPDNFVIDTTGDAALANAVYDQDDGDNIRSDEEEAEAVREAAVRRAEEAQAEQQDVTMTDGDSKQDKAALKSGAEPDADSMQIEEDEEVDELDAFMSGLEQDMDSDMPKQVTGNSTRNGMQVFNASDDEADLDTVVDNTDPFALAAQRRRKKDIPKVDHNKTQYAPFRKNFYSESVELSEMSPEDVEVLRAELDNIKCRGVDVPKPITKWSQGGFGAQILDVIRQQKFETPTSIQSQALPTIMSGRDVIGVAKTGSGKTVAFILPMFRHIKDQPPLENLDGPIGLIMAPTRELATQIHRDCKPYLKALNLRAVCAYGGAPIKDQIAELKRGAEVVVCTPGRMIDLLAANGGRVTNLRRVTYVVLDEADRMFDMGFEPQITKVLNAIRPGRQTVLFSATFPRTMEALARKSLEKPVEIIVGGRSVVAPEITQVIEVRVEGSKFRRLLVLLGELHDQDEDARSLIFVERQETADSLLKDLLKKGYPCSSIHGGREQIDRDQAISDFKAGIFPVMIATSVAARGLDVKQLKLVINFDAPNHIEDYVHRAGRTGRAGNTGTAVTFVTPDQDRFAPFLIKALTDSKQEIPKDLQELREAHDEKVKAGQAKKIGRGFGGKGIERLDAARDAERAVQRKQYKTGDEPDEEDEKGEQKKDAKQTEVEKMVAKAAGVVKERDAQPTEPALPASNVPTHLNDRLKEAMTVHRTERPAPGSKSSNADDKLAKVMAAAGTINSRLGQKGTTRPGAPIDNRGPDAGAFHSTLEINDFPQKARWQVTNRTNVAKILDSTGTSITTKGIYYHPGKEPGTGEEPKLYILVEGDTEVQVSNAMKELTKLLNEGTIAALEAENRAPTGGRYSVV